MDIAGLTAGQTTTVLPPGDEGNACKRRLPQPRWRSEYLLIEPGRRHQWLTPHPSRSRSNADCRPLLQQSLPNRGQVVQPGNERKGITSRLAMDAGLIDTPLAPPQVPQEKPQPHTWNVRPQAPTPAASTDHCHWNVDSTLTLGLCSGVFGWTPEASINRAGKNLVKHLGIWHGLVDLRILGLDFRPQSGHHAHDDHEANRSDHDENSEQDLKAPRDGTDHSEVIAG